MILKCVRSIASLWTPLSRLCGLCAAAGAVVHNCELRFAARWSVRLFLHALRRGNIRQVFHVCLLQPRFQCLSLEKGGLDCSWAMVSS